VLNDCGPRSPCSNVCAFSPRNLGPPGCQRRVAARRPRNVGRGLRSEGGQSTRARQPRPQSAAFGPGLSAADAVEARSIRRGLVLNDCGPRSPCSNACAFSPRNLGPPGCHRRVAAQRSNGVGRGLRSEGSQSTRARTPDLNRLIWTRSCWTTVIQGLRSRMRRAYAICQLSLTLASALR
jgi:hypothetical protein